jgi:V8-like Glu-specific endopeptidase
MSRQGSFLQMPLYGRVLLSMLAIVYVGYLVAFGNFLYSSVFPSSVTIDEQPVNANPGIALQYWTATTMRDAINADQQNNSASNLTQSSLNTSAGKAVKQQGQAPSNANVSYPLSTVGKIFFTNDAGQNMVCSGTAVASLNHNVVDTAGHCLYWSGNWVKNVIFCPLYNNGNTPYSCWAARDLEVPSDWINAQPNVLYHDMGMIIVSPNSEGNLTDVVGGAGWAYNQSTNQTYSAYGYPAAPPFDGQTRQSCENASGTSWKQGGGTVISIPCKMNGGSSGGPWFIQSGGNWYLNGHNDFTSSSMRDHMFSPYYDDTWYALYNKAQNS